jgi:hypothetical protein
MDIFISRDPVVDVMAASCALLIFVRKDDHLFWRV